MSRHFGMRIEQINGNLNDLANDMDELTGGRNSRAATESDLRNDSMLKMQDTIAGLRNDLRQHVSHMNTQANSMITAMASDYRCVYYVNLDEDVGICFRGDPNDVEQTPEGIQIGRAHV